MPPTVRQRTLRAAKVQMFQDKMFTRANHASLSGQKDLFTLARNIMPEIVVSLPETWIDGCEFLAFYQTVGKGMQYARWM